MKVFFTVSLVALALAGCASRENSGASGRDDGALTDAVLSPFSDLNMRRDEIPPSLAGMDSPYGSGAEMACDAVATELRALEAVLGPDWDTFNPEDQRNGGKLADEASDAALGAVESGTTGWIPFRGLLRKASGAEGHADRLERALNLGAQRRAYLKGYGFAKGCDMPARPDFGALAASALAAESDAK